MICKGEIYGGWIVTGKTEIVRKSLHYICRCLCCKNNIRSFRKSELASASKKCRVCFSKQNKLDFEGLSEFEKKYFSSIKAKAKQRKIFFDLTARCIYKKLKEQNYKCALSGVDISINDALNTASLDRIHSGRPYSKSNVQWVYKDINRMKGALNNETFILLCKIVVANNNN